MTVQIKTAGSQTFLEAPYHPALPAKARALGGKWVAATKSWMFDARDEDRVREMARSVYGTDGSTPAELVTVRVPMAGRDSADTLWLFGREIACRAGRDWAVRLGAGVIIVEGGFAASGGSRNNPRLDARPGTVLEVRDIPASIELPEDVTVVDASIDRAALGAEREKLLARLAEIDAILGDVQSVPVAPAKSRRPAGEQPTTNATPAAQQLGLF